MKAVKEKLTPQEICDKYYHIHSQVYKWFNISFDIFGRTSTPQQTQWVILVDESINSGHSRISQEIFWCLYDKGYIVKDSMDQFLCIACDKYMDLSIYVCYMNL